MSVDHSSYRHIFAGGIEVYYIAGVEVSAASQVGSPTLNVLRAIPFIPTGSTRTVDRLAISITSASPGNCRVGFYTNTSSDILYPAALVVDSGLLPTTPNGIKTAVVSTPLVAGQLYWAAHVASVTAGMRCLSEDQVLNILGISPSITNALNLGISVPFAFAALPDPFPPSGGATVINAPPVPAIALRFGP